jgi:seryl-tRNA synthetase
MPKDFDDLYKKLDQNHKSNQKDNDEIAKVVNSIDRDHNKLLKEVNDIKKEVKDIAFKVDTMLEILNSFTIMLAEEDDESLEDNYSLDHDTDETWVPKEDDFWEDDNDE